MPKPLHLTNRQFSSVSTAPQFLLCSQLHSHSQHSLHASHCHTPRWPIFISQITINIRVNSAELVNVPQTCFTPNLSIRPAILLIFSGYVSLFSKPIFYVLWYTN